MSSLLTIQQLVEEHKVVLDAFLVELAKVASSDLDDPIAELEHQCCIGITLCDRRHIQVLMANVEEGGASERDDRCSHIRIGHDLDAEDLCNRPSRWRVSE